MEAPKERPCLELRLNRQKEVVSVCIDEEIARGCEEGGDTHRKGKEMMKVRGKEAMLFNPRTDLVTRFRRSQMQSITVASSG